MPIDSRNAPVFLARVADFVGGERFPANRTQLIARARRANTASDIYAVLLELPDRTFESEGDLRVAVGELVGRKPT